MVETREPGALLTRITTIDEVLSAHAAALGHDFVPYRNHVYRVVNLCVSIAGDPNALEKSAVAAAFHDLGIWTHQTFDYLAPSIALARDYLEARGQRAWIDEITLMIAEHHKVTPSTAGADSLAEAFRRADWIDVTRGFRRFGVRRRFIASLYAAWPSAGFHWRLVGLSALRLRTHPLSPLPMFKL